jgi:hypothetical protein
MPALGSAGALEQGEAEYEGGAGALARAGGDEMSRERRRVAKTGAVVGKDGRAGGDQLDASDGRGRGTDAPASLHCTTPG